jgi:hypothetical protein
VFCADATVGTNLFVTRMFVSPLSFTTATNNAVIPAEGSAYVLTYIGEAAGTNKKRGARTT